MEKTLTFEQIEQAVDAGKLEMVRPQGDWVRVRRRGKTFRFQAPAPYPSGLRIPLYMENQVEAEISSTSAAIGFPDIRIAA